MKAGEHLCEKWKVVVALDVRGEVLHMIAAILADAHAVHTLSP